MINSSNDLFKEHKGGKFVVWTFPDSDLAAVLLVDENWENYEKFPAKNINWFKVFFSKKYRSAIKSCFNYAIWNANIFRGYGSIRVMNTPHITKVPLKNNSKNFFYIKL